MFYTDYCWKEGIPKGIAGKFNTYEILSDPYGKRYLVILHKETGFPKLIYDSAVIDFRHLNPRHQLGWTKEHLAKERFLIRDREHMPLFIESHTFSEELPIACDYYSIQEYLFAHQKIHYVHRSDAFNGVTLFDILGKPVLQKEYEINRSFEFTDLKKEINSF